MDEQNNFNQYKTVASFSEKKKSSFGKSVLVPFISGILGTVLVIGVCFGVPQVRQKLFSFVSIPVTSTNNTSTDTQTTVNTTQVSLSDYSDTGISVAEKVMPSIVGIKVEYTVNSFFNQQSTANAEGSGIIISKDGYILTNNHIINSTNSSSFYQVSEANKIEVYLYNDETAYEATIVGTDEQTDLAVIKIDKTDLTPATLGDSDNVKVGEFSMAVGNPLGLKSSVTGGLISAVNRDVTDTDGKKYTLIQTDAAINSGNSGGALVNSKGEVIGINTLKLSGTGIEGMGFAIPINSTKDIYSQLIQYSKVKRPYIGIEGIDLTEQQSEYYNLPLGVYIRAVEDFSAGQKAGLKAGDVIIKADGTDVKTMDEINELKNKHQIGDTFTLVINRDGQEMTIDIVLGEEP